MPKMDLGKLEDDMGSIEDTRGQLRPRKGMGSGVPPARGMASARPRPNPADAGIFTADKDIQPPSPDEGPTLDREMSSKAPIRPVGSRQIKAAKDMRAAMGMKKGGSVSSASKRADGIAQKGKTKGKIC